MKQETRGKWWWSSIIVFFIFSARTPQAQPQSGNWRQQAAAQLGNGSILIEEMNGRPVYAHRAEDYFIPASIMKLGTSACAILNLRPEYRFQTAIAVDNHGTLYVKGFGDPALTSEEMARIAQALRQKGLRAVGNIVLDGSFFAPDITIDGQSSSANPYDALNSALLVNYNTINVRKLQNGTVQSAEPQTPMTEMTAQLAKGLRAGTHRINISRDPGPAMLYVGHLLKAFLLQQQIPVSGTITVGRTPPATPVFYLHRSSRSLFQNIHDLLEHSNNLMTNQLFLAMGAEKFGAPATLEKAQNVMAECLQQRFGWRNFRVVEGSGLSRLNQVTARQMMQLVRFFERYTELMPNKEPPFLAKTGTLNGVSTLAGFFTTPQRQTYRFVLMMNSPGVGYWSKFKVAKLLYDGLSGNYALAGH